MPLPKPLADVLALPTAPFCEAAVLTYLEDACRDLPGVKLRHDRYGNLLAHYRHQPRKITPLAFVAHTDHPGFVAEAMVRKNVLRAAFRGGVKVEYFADSRVRFLVDDQWTRGRVLRLSKVDPPRVPGGNPVPKEAHIEVRRDVPPGCLGMWDLPKPSLRKDRVQARVCDDLAGVAAALTLLQRLSRKRAGGEVYVLFTRAEEVGFVGAVGAIQAGTLPKRVAVVSIETSSALPNAPIGAGPILRVGDRGTMYTPRLAAFTTRVAQELAKRKKAFQYQRKLMDGGMCEASAFGSYGFDVTGICLALGNYHNMNTRRQRIGSEYVGLRDYENMVDLFEALVLDKQGPGVADGQLRQRIDKLFAESKALLGNRH